MHKEFEILCSNTGSTLIFRGEVPTQHSGFKGDKFGIAIKSNHLSANVDVYDINHESWPKFFVDLACHWRGWIGEKSHGSLEGDLEISATSDSLGHITLRVTLRSYDWKAIETFYVEAGQLETIAKKAAHYRSLRANSLKLLTGN
jgi:hypothetical protein